MAQSPPQRLHAPFKFAFRVRVRFAETDAQGVVNNAAYLVYLEVARLEYWRALELLGRANQTVAEAAIQYRSPARWDDQIDVACRVMRLGRTSMRLGYELREAASDRLLATGHTVQVLLDGDRPTPLPQQLRDILLQFEGADLEQA
ncbi:MAG: acyl-CoA thioesterase [Deltaproteobacteria bacterium]|nr:acyl-CoA thioesterase [Deltaproteobacteria bacterium]